MARRFFIMLGMVAALSVLAGAWLFAEGKDAGKGKVPPFTITSKDMTFNINVHPLVVTYTGNVKFVSPQNSTTITCEKLVANGADANKVTTVTATGNVVFKSISESGEKEKSKTQIDGKAEKTTYTLEDGKRIIRMYKVNGVQPSLILTDLNDKTKQDLTGTGDVIEYNIDTGEVHIGNPNVGNQGGDQ
ncbi:MAG TPA: hypothetical protein VGM23_10280 [Armatimonadota bacterium]|jgi:lipopolysaccharide transport protein LptA